MTGKIDITGYLPHRAPFLMVDFITALDEEKVETEFSILPDNIFVDSNGFFNESGLVENAAQTCAAIVAKRYFVDDEDQEKEGANVVGFISAIKTLQILSLPESGAILRTTSHLVSKFVTDDYSLCTMACKTFAGERLLLEGEINLFIQQQPAGVVAKSNV